MNLQKNLEPRICLSNVNIMSVNLVSLQFHHIMEPSTKQQALKCKIDGH